MDHVYEMTENDIYTLRQGNTATTIRNDSTTATKVGKSWKCFGVVLALATLLNFVLIIGVGVALFYQTSEVRQFSQGIIGESSHFNNMSGPPGPPGKVLLYI